MPRQVRLWPRSAGGRVGVMLSVCVVVAALIVVVVRRGGSTSGSGTAGSRGTGGGTLRAGAFVRVPGAYDSALRAAFTGDSFRAAFGVRAPSALSTRGYVLPATRGATGLLQVRTTHGDVIALNLIPVPVGFTIQSSTTGFRSTAVALVAMSPGLVTADPYADLLLEREIGQLPETDVLSSDLLNAAHHTGALYLARPDATTTIAIASAVKALEARLASDATMVRADPSLITTTPSGPRTGPTSSPPLTTPTNPQPAPSWNAGSYQRTATAHPPSCDGTGLTSQGGLEGDDVCVTALDDTSPPDVADEEVSVRAVNRSPRWDLMYRPNSHDLWPSGVITPKTWSVPGLSDLLGAVAEATANSSATNGWKSTAAWLDNIGGTTYDPYYGADDFIAALQLSVRKFAADSVSDLTLTPDASRQFDTLTVLRPRWADDPGVPPETSGWQAALPSLLTFFDGVIKPVVLVVMDIKAAADNASKAAEENQTSIASKAGTTVYPGAGCKRRGSRA